MNLFDSNLYSFSWYAVPVTVVGCLVLAIGLFIWKQNITSLHNFSFFSLCLSVFVWLSGYGWIYSITDPNIALNVYRRYTFLGVAFISASVYFFSAVWLDLWKQQKKIVIFGHTLFFTFYFLAAAFDKVIPYMDRYYWGLYSRYDWIGIVFFASFIIFFVMSFINFAYRLIHPIEKVSKKQLSAILVAFCIAFTACVDFIPKLVHFEIYPFGYISASLWILTVAYSIIKYKVMNIETVIHQTILWLATSLIVIFPIFCVFYIMPAWYQKASAGIFALFSSVLFFAFFLYLKTVQPHVDHFFKRRELDLQRTLIKFNNSLVHLKDLTELSNYIVQTVQNAIYVHKVQVFLKHSGGTSLIRIDAEADGEAEPSYENKFIKWLAEKDNVAITEFIEIDPWFESVKSEAKRFFQQLDIQAVVPLVLNHELIGLINLGKKANLKPFRGPEIAFLSELRHAATIALSNSLRLIEMQESLRQWNEQLEEKVRLRTHELEEAQKQLIQAEKLATLGTLAGGVAHEINNPLTAILTNIQLLKLDNNNQEDAESLELIEAGARRCRDIIQKIMKYARKPTGPEILEKIDINKVVNNITAFLDYQLQQDNIKLSLQIGDALPYIEGNSNELEQVLTNLILNASDAIKQSNREGIINLSTGQQNGKVFIKVQDNGSGISKENISKIFDPFFTTKEVGKGTGLGLAISYGIVEKHGGKIHVSSKPDKETIFLIEFPHLNGKK